MKYKPQSPKIIKINTARAPGMRTSIFRRKYPSSTAEEWRLIDDHGWMHLSEEYIFMQDFKKCIISGKVLPNSDVHAIMNKMESGEVKYISSAELNKETSLYFIDGYCLKAALKTTRVTAKDTYGDLIYISEKTKLSEFNFCHVTRYYYPKETILHIYTDLLKNKAWRGLLLVHDGPICKCGSCHNVFYKADASGQHGIDGYRDSYLCTKCEIKLKTETVIRPHNYNIKLPFIYTPEFNTIRGERVERESYRLFGVEVETEFSSYYLLRDKKNRFDMAKEILESIGRGFIVIKEDGSLITNGHYSGDKERNRNGEVDGFNHAGFEIVSAPADLAAHRLHWPLLEKIENFNAMRAWDTETCGLHVHVSREAMGSLQIGRILAFVNHPANANLIRRIAGRGKNKYCVIESKLLSDSLRPERGKRDECRRVAVNVQNGNTIEFRIFRGTVRPCHIIRNIEFVDATCDYCCPAGRSFRDLSFPQNFINFCMANKKRWPFLSGWLVASGALDGWNIPNREIARAAKLGFEESMDGGTIHRAITDWDAIGLRGAKKKEAANF
jgi:hypothetical protein